MPRKTTPAFPAFKGKPEAAQWDLEMQKRDKTQKGKRSNSVPKRAMEAAFERVRRRLDEAEWEGATALDFVAAHAELHRRVYGSPPADLEARERTQAAFAAGRMLKDKFGGDAFQMAEYFAWTWTREAQRIKVRLPNFRISWRAQFGNHLFDDWRLATVHQRRPA